MRSAIIVAALTLSHDCAAQTVRYVNITSAVGGNGQSWSTAYNNLDDALADEQAEHIWVAKGVYRPSNEPFTLRDGLVIYGGFVGGETDAAERDPVLNVTTLTGVKGVWHVVLCNGVTDARLDGFTIRDGLAAHPSGSGPDVEGAGIWIGDSDLTIANCVFTGNLSYAESGGSAIYMQYSSASILSCQFLDNIEAGSEQGTVYCIGSELFVRNCLFSGNAALYAAGISALSSNVTVRATTFLPGKIGVEVAHGLILYGGTHSIQRCTFLGSGTDGPGAIKSVDANTTIEGCLFRDYICSIEGGAIRSEEKGSLTVISSIFANNRCVFNAVGDGSAIHASGGNFATVVNCAFRNNTAPELAATDGSKIFVE